MCADLLFALWGGLPVVIFDDLKLTEPSQSAVSAYRAMAGFIDILGWKMDPAKDQRMADKGQFLGFEELCAAIAL